MILNNINMVYNILISIYNKNQLINYKQKSKKKMIKCSIKILEIYINNKLMQKDI